MRSSLKSVIFAITFGLLFFQFSAGAQELVVNFPKIDGWEKGETTKYPSPALGYSIGYESEAGEIVTVYVYNGGLKTISEDINHKVIKDEMDRAKGEIHKVEELGYYKNVKELKTETITLGGEKGKIKALRALFAFTAREQNVSSEIIIWSYQNHFIKIRATRKAKKEMTNSPEFDIFLAEMDRLFSKSGTLAIF